MTSDYLMRLGNYTFAMETAAYQQLQRTNTYRWQAQDRIGRQPAQQYLGLGEETITLEGVIYPHFRGGLRQLDAMRAEAGQGRPLMLTDGTGQVFSLWVIKAVEETRKVLAANGTPHRMDFRLSLARYGEDAHALP